MKKIVQNGIRWFLDDGFPFEDIKRISFEEGQRRGHLTCQVGGKRVFVKFFVEKGIAGLIRNMLLPRGKMEYIFGKRLCSLSIPTPNPVGYGVSKEGSYIIQEYTEGPTFLEAYLDEKGKGYTGPLLEGLAGLLVNLRLKRIRHNDLHLNNIIVHKGMLSVVDLHKMQRKGIFTKKDELSNLSHAFTMIYPMMSEEERGLLYKACGAEGIRAEVEAEIERLRKRWIKRKMERAFKETSRIEVESGLVYVRGRKGVDRGELLSIIKDDKKTRVERYADHIRKFYRDGRRLKRAWRNHIALCYLNLSLTPAPYHVRLPRPFSKGYIAMEDLAAKRGEELDRYLDRHYDHLSLKERRGLLALLSTLFTEMIKERIVHEDMKACNLFFIEGVGIKLLDIEDIRFKEVKEGEIERMMVRLNTTIPKRIGNGERIRFFLMVCNNLRVDKRQLFKRIREASLKEAIVYEGAAGLVVDSW